MDEREKFWRQISEALREFSPAAVVQNADRPINLALVAETSDVLRQMESFFVPRFLGSRKAAQVRERYCSFVLPLGRTELEGLQQLDLVICSPGARAFLSGCLPRVFTFSPQTPQAAVREILDERWNLALPLARNFLVFRRAVNHRLIRSLALENALIAMMAAVSEVVPAPFPLTRVLGGLVSSTILLTANQMRLAFLMAASNDSEVGFRKQTGQLTTIAAAALGWRFLARELAGRISPVSDLLTKGMLAFAATYATGLALEQLHIWGRSMTREEKAVAFEEAYRVGRMLLDRFLDTRASRKASM